MYLSLDPRGSREPGRVVMDIIDGRPWVASRIRNNNLRQHCHMLGRTFRPSEFAFGKSRALCRRLLAVVVARSGLLTEVHPVRLGTVPLLLRMAWHGKWWRRQPEDWTPEPGVKPHDQWRSLVRHLFCRDGVRLPAFFESAWLTNGTLTHMERSLYCHVAAGMSLRSAKDLSRSISTRALRSAMQAPAHFTIRQALRHGQVLALGGSAGLAREVIANRMVHDFSHDRIWLRLMEKTVAASGGEAGDFGMIADVLIPQLRKCRWSRIDELLKLPMSDLRRHVLRYWTGLEARCAGIGAMLHFSNVRSEGGRRWLDDTCRPVWSLMPATQRLESFPHGRWDWQIHQLTSGLELGVEGREIKYDLTTVSGRCFRGELAVFSFRLAEPGDMSGFEHCFTLEVDVVLRKALRIHGHGGHGLNLRQASVVREWAIRNRMGFPSHWER